VSIEKLIQVWRVDLGLEGKPWSCFYCKYGVMGSAECCGYVRPFVPLPRVCIYVQHRVQRLLAELLGPLEDEED